MRKVIFGVLAIAIGAFSIYAVAVGNAHGRADDGSSLGVTLFGCVFILLGIVQLVRRGGPPTRAGRIVEGVVAVALAAVGIAQYATARHATGVYATGELIGVIAYAVLFGGFGLVKILKRA